MRQSRAHSNLRRSSSRIHCSITCRRVRFLSRTRLVSTQQSQGVGLCRVTAKDSLKLLVIKFWASSFKAWLNQFRHFQTLLSIMRASQTKWLRQERLWRCKYTSCSRSSPSSKSKTAQPSTPINRSHRINLHKSSTKPWIRLLTYRRPRLSSKTPLRSKHALSLTRDPSNSSR